MARAIVGSASQPADPASTAPMKGSNASLISHVAEAHRCDGLWLTP